MKSLDIAPFALPNCAPGEIRFEEVRDIERVVVTFGSDYSGEPKLTYQRNTWPQRRIERDYGGVHNAMGLGWYAIDDWFNSPWEEAAAVTRRIDGRTVEFTFKGLHTEIAKLTDYDVTFRRTLGLRVEADAPVEKFEVYTRWEPAETEFEVRLDCGKRTPGSRIELEAYNGVIEGVEAVSGVGVDGMAVTGDAADRRFRVRVAHVKPTMEYSFDNALISFALEHDKFTISLRSLEEQGPIWYEEEGIFVKKAGDPTTFEQYLKSIEGKQTLNEVVSGTHDQGLGGALLGQPRAHPTSQSIGCKHARQRFWVEYNGDIVLSKRNVGGVKMSDTPRFKNDPDGRIFFGLERWRSMGRFADPAPVLCQNNHFHRDGIVAEQKSFAAPLLKNVAEPLVGDDSIIALIRFRFRNEGLSPEVAELPIDYSHASRRSENRYGLTHWNPAGDDYLVPTSERVKLSVASNAAAPSLKLVSSSFNGEDVVRFALETGMEIVQTDKGLVLRKTLQPGETCEALVKAPFVSLESGEEIKALDGMAFETLYAKVREFWTAEAAKGAQLHTPEAKLDDLHRTHISHIQAADFSMPDDPYIVNTSVGSSTYGNYTNESVMILQELEERGLHEDVRRRLTAWLKYQGTVGLMGNFTDHDGVFFGAGGFESGQSYSQHHGWGLWHIAEHYLMTGDDEWFKGIADQVVTGADWVFRQRKNTMGQLPHSRGWEHGFMPAAALEDVADYFYWLTTNTMSWKGTDGAAEALEAAGHPEAARVRKEADAFKADLIRGFETARQHSPIVRLRNGKWVPHFPSRLYVRGRDVGWIREILEGSIYLLIMGLFDPNSKQGQWIVDDYQDNRYISENYGYPVHDPPKHWYDVAGFSCQPCLLAGLMPHLDRDEPEIYIWMFFNAWASIYREETNVMVEHPSPILGQSNSAWVKTSDMANAIKWLRYLVVYGPKDGLYIGKALPREWLKHGRAVGVTGMATRHGNVDAIYTPMGADGIKLEAKLDLRKSPGRIIARFRHPESAQMKGVTVNGQAYTKFDPARGDVDLTGMSGKLEVVASY